MQRGTLQVLYFTGTYCHTVRAGHCLVLHFAHLRVWLVHIPFRAQFCQSLWRFITTGNGEEDSPESLELGLRFFAWAGASIPCYTLLWKLCLIYLNLGGVLSGVIYILNGDYYSAVQKVKLNLCHLFQSVEFVNIVHTIVVQHHCRGPATSVLSPLHSLRVTIPVFEKWGFLGLFSK